MRLLCRKWVVSGVWVIFGGWGRGRGRGGGGVRGDVVSAVSSMGWGGGSKKIRFFTDYKSI